MSVALSSPIQSIQILLSNSLSSLVAAEAMPFEVTHSGPIPLNQPHLAGGKLHVGQ